MSNGQEKTEEMKLVTLDPEEFDAVVKRVHVLLLHRLHRAKIKKDNKPSERSDENHIESAKDVFVFVHMLDLIEHMSAEISDLRDLVTSMGGDINAPRDPEEGLGFPELFTGSRTKYKN
jgi:hypothetical protein